MAKETKHHRDERKKPTMSAKERRAKKHEIKQQKSHRDHFEEPIV